MDWIGFVWYIVIFILPPALGVFRHYVLPWIKEHLKYSPNLHTRAAQKSIRLCRG